MNKKLFYGGSAVILLILMGIAGYIVYQRTLVVEVADTATTTSVTNETENFLYYRNNTYGFSVPLPESWRGYSVKEQPMGSYLEVQINHPESTTQNPRMNIPILVVPITTWNKWYPASGEGSHPFAAPIPATERARNAKYVFATAPRYNYSFATGYEEVDEIVKKIIALNIFPIENQPTQQVEQVIPTETFPLFEEGEIKG